MQKGVAGGQVVHRGVSERCCSPFAGEWSGRLLALQLLPPHSYFWALACFLSMETQRIQWGKMIRLLENVHIRKDGLMAMRMSIEQPILISVTLQVIQFHRAQAIEWQKNWTRPASISWHFLRNWLDGLELPIIGGIKGSWSTLQMQNGSCDEARTSKKKAMNIWNICYLLKSSESKIRIQRCNVIAVHCHIGR